jgi:hypothetical protein
VRISGRFAWVEFLDVRAANAALACVSRPPSLPVWLARTQVLDASSSKHTSDDGGMAVVRTRRLDGETTGGHHLRVSQSKSAIHSNGLKKRAPAGVRSLASHHPQWRAVPSLPERVARQSIKPG